MNLGISLHQLQVFFFSFRSAFIQYERRIVLVPSWLISPTLAIGTAFDNLVPMELIKLNFVVYFWTCLVYYCYNSEYSGNRDSFLDKLAEVREQ